MQKQVNTKRYFRTLNLLSTAIVTVSAFLAPCVVHSTSDSINTINQPSLHIGLSIPHTKPLKVYTMIEGYYTAEADMSLEDFYLQTTGNKRAPEATSPAHLRENCVQVVVDTAQSGVWNSDYDAISIYVVNTSNRSVEFATEDRRLYLNVQARDSDGVWRDIECLTESDCGNSYFSLFLKPNRVWKFMSPQYVGSKTTVLRVKLEYLRTKDELEQTGEARNVILYSREFLGSVNPGQFWNYVR